MITEREGAIRLGMPGKRLSDAEKVELLLDVLSEVYSAPGLDARRKFADALEGGVTQEEFSKIYLLFHDREVVFDQTWSVKELRAAAEKNAAEIRQQLKRFVQMSVFCTAVCVAVFAIISLISKG